MKRPATTKPMSRTASACSALMPSWKASGSSARRHDSGAPFSPDWAWRSWNACALSVSMSLPRQWYLVLPVAEVSMPSASSAVAVSWAGSSSSSGSFLALLLRFCFGFFVLPVDAPQDCARKSIMAKSSDASMPAVRANDRQNAAPTLSCGTLKPATAVCRSSRRRAWACKSQPTSCVGTDAASSGTSGCRHSLRRFALRALRTSGPTGRVKERRPATQA
mmetsp:Transcript_73403/g.189358  ORF Transcript_73403/g.189358 Transcript_73403/m.189358 type:complete len:220 (+) Transcript_73403:1096-1755(+)